MNKVPVVEVLITDQTIDPDEVPSASPADGAVVSFLGVVRGSTDGRGVEGLDYEAYGDMASRQLREIAREAGERWRLSRVRVVHRTGALDVGDVSVLVAVTAPHREEAFEACRFVIDTLKDRAAIWKKERFSDGSSRWVEHP